MTEHITIQKLNVEGKNMMEISMYGKYEDLFALLMTSARINKVLMDLICDVYMDNFNPDEAKFSTFNLN